MDTTKQEVEQLKAALQTHSKALTDSLERGGLLPGPAGTDGLIPAGFEPQIKLEVSYNGKDIELGTFFRAGECTASPAVSFQSENKEESHVTYTLMMVDPDAPTPDDPKFAFWRHWIVTGLQPPSGESSVVSISNLHPVTQYHPPGPKADSKPHRYLFLLFREPTVFDLKKEDVGGEEFVQRRSFKPAELARKFGLTLVGVNWMNCVADDWKE